MTLYFVNGSKQEKKLIETEFADDAYDTMIGFFEEHGKYPHFINMTDEGDDLTPVYLGGDRACQGQRRVPRGADDPAAAGLLPDAWKRW